MDKELYFDTADNEFYSEKEWEHAIYSTEFELTDDICKALFEKAVSDGRLKKVTNKQIIRDYFNKQRK